MSRDDRFSERYRQVFDEQFASLFRYLNRLTGDATGAADIAQEAFVRLYQRGALPDDTRAWLATVANNLVRDEHRKWSRRKRLMEANATLFEEGAGQTDPEAHADRAQQRRRVRTVLETLPIQYRQALLLRHEGYSYREIGEALEYGVSGVGKLIVRASRAFKEAYEEAYAPE